MKKYDIVALGELLVDLTTEDGLNYKANPGGAPANVLAMASALGSRTAFMGMVGRDQFGKKLLWELGKQGIDTTCTYRHNSYPTTIAFVSNHRETGEREFSFYGEATADTNFAVEHLEEVMLKSTTLFHFGSISMRREPSKGATIAAVGVAKGDALISFDPNLRASLWEKEEDLFSAVEYGMRMSDIVKVSLDELEFFTKKKEMKAALKYLKEEYQITIIFVTDSERGSYCYYEDKLYHADAFLQGGSIDTTGAGDCFYGTVLHLYLKGERDFEKILRYGNAAAYYITTKKGALSQVPRLEQIKSIIDLGAE